MPNGAWCNPKRLLQLLIGAALREAVGSVGFLCCLTNIGSGAWAARLPGTLGAASTLPPSPSWPCTTSSCCSTTWPWTLTSSWTSATTRTRSMASSAAGSVPPWRGFNEGLIHPSVQQPAPGRQRIVLYKKKLDSQKKSKEATLNLLTSLTGVSWRQVEHLVEKVADSEGRFEQVLAQLDRCFKYDDQMNRVEMP